MMFKSVPRRPSNEIPAFGRREIPSFGRVKSRPEAGVKPACGE